MSYWVGSKMSQFVVFVLLLLAVVVSLPELFLYRGIILSNFGVSIELIFIILLSISILSRLFLKISVSGRIFAIYTFIGLPILIGSSIAISLIDAFTYSNFVYSNFHLDTNSLFDISFLFLLLSVPLFNFEFIKKHREWSFFTLGVILFYIFVFLKWRLGFIFFEINGEDEILEYAQVFLYLTSSILAAISFRLVRKLKIKNKLKIVWLTFLVLSALTLFVVAIEEVSWGQRFFNIETPETLKEINRQGETNIHNIDGVFGRVYDAYLIAAIYGLLSWLIFFLPFSIGGIKLQDYIKIFLSRWFLMPFFLVMIGYVLWRYNGPATGYHLWEEVAELFFAIGIFSIFLLGFNYIKNFKK